MRSGMWKTILGVVAFCCIAASVPAQQGTPAWPTKEGDYMAHNFRFSDGQTLPEVRLHYTRWARHNEMRADE